MRIDKNTQEMFKTIGTTVGILIENRRYPDNIREMSTFIGRDGLLYAIYLSPFGIAHIYHIGPNEKFGMFAIDCLTKFITSFHMATYEGACDYKTFVENNIKAESYDRDGKLLEKLKIIDNGYNFDNMFMLK